MWVYIVGGLFLLYLFCSSRNSKTLVISFPTECVNKLEKVRQNVGLPDKVETVRHAIALYELISEYELLGGETCIHMPDGEVIPIEHSLIKKNKS